MSTTSVVIYGQEDGDHIEVGKRLKNEAVKRCRLKLSSWQSKKLSEMFREVVDDAEWHGRFPDD